MNSLSDYFRKLEAIEKVSQLYPRKAGVIALKFVKDRFVQQAWIGDNVEPWRSRRLNPGGRGTLIGKGSGALKRSYRITAQNRDQIRIGTDKAYAPAHNEGVKIVITDKMRKFFWAKHYELKEKGNSKEAEYFKNLALTKKSFIELPKRQMIGPSKALTRLLDEAMLNDFNKALRK